MASERRTRKKSRNSGFLHVRSMPHIKMLEKMIKKKDTLVYIYAPWCGACRDFDANVMNHVQSLKNKSMNIAKVDSKLAYKTGLPAAQYLPTLMVVKNGVPETFTDESGNQTNVMPRGKTLDEDRETLTNLVQNSNNTFKTMKNTPNTLKRRNTPYRMSLPSYDKSGSPGRSTVTLNSLSKSMYDAPINGMPTPSNEKLVPSLENGSPSLENGSVSVESGSPPRNTQFSPIKNSIKASIPVSSPPDIGADLFQSYGRNKMNEKKSVGGMLNAIRQKTNSLNSLLHLRKTRKH